MKSDKKKATKETTEDVAAGATGAIKGFVEEVENTSTSLAAEVKQHFDDLTVRVSDVVSSAAETTVSMAEKVTVKDPADLIRGLLEEIKQASEVSIKVIGDRFDELVHRGKSTTDETPKKKAEKKSAKKKAAKKTSAKKKVGKKAASKKKAVTKKKAAKKAAAKKTSAKKKVGKKAASKKKAVAKQKVAKKSKTKKSSLAKQTATRKKTVARKKAASKKKATTKK